MATQVEWSCPICRDSEDDVSYVTPCLHQFCLGCIVRWAKRKPSCPLCRQPINSILYSVRSEVDFLEIIVQQPSDPSVAGHPEQQRAVRPAPRAQAAGFQPEVWAGLFRGSLEILEPLLSWLNQVLHRACWWELALAQGTVITNLCRYGLDEEALVRELEPFLQHQTATFVRQLISVATGRCREQILQQRGLLHSRAAEEREDGPADSPGPADSLEGTPAPSPRAQEEPREELGPAVADPSAAGRGRDWSPAGPSAPRRGGPAAPRPLQPTGDHTAGSTRVPQKLAKPGPG